MAQLTDPGGNFFQDGSLFTDQRLDVRSFTTTFTFRTTPREGDAEGTLFALYPHQWRNLAGDLRFVGEYDSVRGKMKLA